MILNMSDNTLATKLRLMRTQIGYTQEQVSSIIGFTRQGYGHFENGKRKPDYEILQKLADLYLIPLYSLLDESITPEQLADFVEARRHATKAQSPLTVCEKPSFHANNSESDKDKLSLTADEAVFLQLYRKLTHNDRDELYLIMKSRLSLHKTSD